MQEPIKKVRGFWSEFRAFAVKGNVFDLAVAVVVGTSFTAIVNSLVADVITPTTSLFTGGGVNELKNLSITLTQGGAEGQAIVLRYGAFLQTIANFLVVSLAIFVMFKLLTSARRKLFKEEESVPKSEKPAQERLLEEIRDLLRERDTKQQ